MKQTRISCKDAISSGAVTYSTGFDLHVLTMETNPLLVESAPPGNHKGGNRSRKNQTKLLLLTVTSCLLLAGVIAVIVVFVSSDDNDEQRSDDQHSNDFYEQQFLQIPSNDSCHALSLQFASKPHVAGTRQTLEIGELFADKMISFGFDVIRDPIQNQVLDHYNASQLLINDEEWDLSQPAIGGQPETNTSFRHRSWIAYSASGDHTAPLLYVNGGSEDDYRNLTQRFGIDLSNGGRGYIGSDTIEHN